MKNPISRKVEYYKTLDAKDRRSFWIDGLLNNAIYIILVIFLIYTATQNTRLLSWAAVVNLITLVAANLPMALGIGGCIILTGTDLSAGRVVGLSAGLSAALLQGATAANKYFEGLGEPGLGMVFLSGHWYYFIFFKKRSRLFFL